MWFVQELHFTKTEYKWNEILTVWVIVNYNYKEFELLFCYFMSFIVKFYRNTFHILFYFDPLKKIKIVIRNAPSRVVLIMKPHDVTKPAQAQRVRHSRACFYGSPEFELSDGFGTESLKMIFYF